MDRHRDPGDGPHRGERTQHCSLQCIFTVCIPVAVVENEDTKPLGPTFQQFKYRVYLDNLYQKLTFYRLVLGLLRLFEASM